MENLLIINPNLPIEDVCATYKAKTEEYEKNLQILDEILQKALIQSGKHWIITDIDNTCFYARPQHNIPLPKDIYLCNEFYRVGLINTENCILHVSSSHRNEGRLLGADLLKRFASDYNVTLSLSRDTKNRLRDINTSKLNVIEINKSILNWAEENNVK